METDRTHAGNTFYLGVVELFWGAGMNFISMSAILPVMFSHLGASYLEIALIPAMSSLGFGLPQLLSPKFFGHMKEIRGTLMVLHVVTALPLLAASAMLATGKGSVVVTVLICWGSYCSLVGLVFPLWMNYMAKVLDPARRGRAFGTIFFCQTLAGGLGVFLASKIYGQGFDHMRSASLFLLSFVSMAVGALFFIKTREVSFEEESAGARFVNLKELLGRYPWLSRYFAAKWLSRGAFLIVSSFYIVDMIESDLSVSSAAISVGAIALFSQALASLALGRWGDKGSHRKASLLAGAVFLASTIMLSLGSSSLIHIFVGVASGIYFSSEFTSQNSLMIALSRPGDRHAIIAWNGFLNTLPQVLFPIAGGSIMDLYGIKRTALFSSVLLACALLVLFLGVPEPPGREEAGEPGCNRRDNDLRPNDKGVSNET